MTKTIADHIFAGMCTKDLYKSNKGTSRAAIRTYLIQKGVAKDSATLNGVIRRAIKKLLDENVLVVGTTTQRFLVNQDKKQAKLKALNPAKAKKAAPKKKKATKKKSKSVKPKKKATSSKKKATKAKKPATKKATKSKKKPAKKATKAKKTKTTKKAKKAKK